MNLTDDERQALRDGKCAVWIDSETRQEYVVVAREHYERLRAVVDGIARRAGWDDPALDVYEQYRSRPVRDEGG
jgi:hypothetical protein